ncbi:MAG: serine/threonine-protein kinase [Bacillota bacterium]
MDEYIEIEIKEIVESGVKAAWNGEVDFYHEKAFLDYKNVTVGDMVELRYNEKKDYYSQLSLTFSNKYRNANFVPDKVYQGVLLQKINDFWVVKVEGDKFGRLHQDGLLKNQEYEEYDVVNVSVKRTKGVVFSIYEAKFNLFKEGIENQSGEYSFKIVDIEKNINRQKNIKGYDLYTEIGMKIYIPIWDDVLFEKNYNYFKDVLFSEEDLIYNIFYNSSKEHFNLCIENNLNLDPGKPYMGELDYDKGTKEFYVETNHGHCQLQTNMLTYLEKSILHHMVGNDITYNKINRGCDDLVLHSYNEKDVRTIKYDKKENREFKNVEIVNVIDTKIDRRIYILDLEELGFGYMEAADYSYTNQVAMPGEVIERVQVKELLKDHFIFLTRKPYLADPKQEFFRDKELQEAVQGKVKTIYEQFIVVTFNDQFDVSILKEDLLPLNFYQIEEFYQPGEAAEFYLTAKEPKIKLSGYDKNKYQAKLDYYADRTGAKVDGYVYKKMITKYIIRIEDYIEAELPIDEISHLNLGQEKLKNDDLKYNFKILNLEENSAGETRIILSRKQLSDTTFAYQKEYQPGAIVGGTFFHRSSEGFYFNLEHKNKEVKGVVGFLSNDQVALYPDLEEFQQKIINNDEIVFKIVSYPSKLRQDPFLEEKAIELSRIELLDFNIEQYYHNLDSKKLEFGVADIISEGLAYRNQDHRIYFAKDTEQERVIFSLQENNFMPGVDFSSDFADSFFNYLQNMMEHADVNYDLLSSEEKELFRIILNTNSIKNSKLENLTLTNLEKDYFNRYNNTIEINYANYIYSKIKEKFAESKIVIKEEADGNKYGLLFNNSVLGIEVNLLNENIKVGKEYEIKIANYNEKQNVINAVVVSVGEDSIGEVYPLEVVEKLGERKYKVKYLDSSYGVLNDNTSPNMVQGDVVYGELMSIDDEQALFTYDFPIKEIKSKIKTIDLNKFAVNDLFKFIQDEENLRNLELEDIFKVYKTLEKKHEEFGVEVAVNFEVILYLLDNGFKRGKYVFDNQVYGQGNFGLVFRGLDLTTGEIVICKRYTSNRENDEERERFEIEAKILQKLDLEGVVEGYQYLPKKNEYIAEHIPGQTLNEYLKETKERSYEWKKENYSQILLQAAEILDQLSLEDIAHCDLKPENIMYDKSTGEVNIIDFGSIQTDEIKGGFGTIFYASPAQCKIYSNPRLHNSSEHDFTTQDDIYSFGVIMYQMFAGRLPYTDELEEATLVLAHQLGQLEEGREYTFHAPSTYNQQLDRAVEDIILKCMAVQREDRYYDFYELMTELEAI